MNKRIFCSSFKCNNYKPNAGLNLVMSSQTAICILAISSIGPCIYSSGKPFQVPFLFLLSMGYLIEILINGVENSLPGSISPDIIIRSKSLEFFLNFHLVYYFLFMSISSAVCLQSGKFSFYLDIGKLYFFFHKMSCFASILGTLLMLTLDGAALSFLILLILYLLKLGRHLSSGSSKVKCSSIFYLVCA